MEEIIEYALEHGLLDTSDLTHGGVVLRSIPRRNNNWRVERGIGTGVFLKIAGSPDAMHSVAHEAAVLRAVAQARPLRRQLFPVLLVHDTTCGVLATGLAVGRTVRQHAERHGGPRPRVAALAGDALGRLHALSDSLLTRVQQSSPTPWVLSIDSPPMDLYLGASAAGLQFIATAQRFPQVTSALRRIRASWTEGSFIHGDLRWDNVIVDSGSRRVTLVDWETGGSGAAAWDVGSYLAEFLMIWILSIPVSEFEPPERHLASAAQPLGNMLPAAGAFWRAYRSARRQAPQDDRALLIDAMNMAAARMIQLSIESLHRSLRMDGHAVIALQVAANVMDDPHRAAAALLRLDCEAVP